MPSRPSTAFAGYSDFELHCFCLSHRTELGDFLLPPDCVMRSGKLVLLDKLLIKIKAAGGKVNWLQRAAETATSPCLPPAVPVDS